jgi:toxin ParE1/3/4
MRVTWTRPALRELEAIGDYIARDDPVAAGEVVKRILDHTEVLEAHPHIGRPGRIANTRELVVTGTPFSCHIDCAMTGANTVGLHSARKWPESFD